ncbi:NAD(P)/FAD-dependent oxidoreductase [archaeon]|nr:NAD(P)/FAD-dependent oxidoreductase [archaeon]NCP79528.1 NAD(P)/FAD-dependent oxidoreductase [archaeon]NCP97471.1 NAD(P)/FAD-dependent oxidoreductase [archaeon]NCQ07295.1 NAD(P)/FAD-dependent oxidoreductase [archaeon]NCQ51091.1 NAD(P)/FAD-dependent oxidoreductase [archaeon]
MIEGIDKRIIIVGGGPTGLYCAYLLKKLNPNIIITVIEEHKTCGSPMCCSGLIDVSGYNRLKLKNFLVLKDFLINKIYGSHIYGPLEAKIDVLSKDVKAYVIDREKFDNSIKELALSFDVELLSGKRVVSIENNFVTFKDLETDSEEQLRYDYLVGADGPNSLVRKTFFPEIKNSEFVHTYQVTVEGNFDNRNVSVYLGDFAKGLFAWIVPESSSVAKIGLGVSLGKNPKDAFLKFKEKYKLTYQREIYECSGILPISKPLKNLVHDNVLLVGDAACFVKSTTGGGVNFGLLSSEMASKAINERIKEYKSLKNYNTLLKKYRKELNTHYKIRNYLLSKNFVEQDKLLLKIKDSNIHKILEEYGNMDYPSEFLSKIFTNKNSFLLIPEFFKFIIK